MQGGFGGLWVWSSNVEAPGFTVLALYEAFKVDLNFKIGGLQTNCRFLPVTSSLWCL